jgi:alpha/beta hydrolase family protein
MRARMQQRSGCGQKETVPRAPARRRAGSVDPRAAGKPCAVCAPWPDRAGRYTARVSTALIELPDPGTPTRHLLRVGGVHVHWAEAGSGRPTVLLHGVCDSHRSWRKVAAALGRTRRVLMPDLPGHGLSDRPDATYTVEWYGAIVGAWIDALGLKTFDLVGHSYGGGVAQVLLLTHAHRIDRLALVGAGGLGT